ncbi:DMT family transporter [Thalassospira sp. MCCC 1A02491]|uniref:DMT family transporter n=1 Tax=Thalassospira sp. MCCC 1A02491 TaxID=1769751 RepID=UPI0007AD6FAD|nr:transporter [Thalassospira sp. MCCC 1A02491]
MEDLVTQVIAQSVSRTRAGWFSGLMGVVIFSGSLPATRLAVMDFDPVFVTVARAAIAGIIAVLILMVSRPVRPIRSQWVSLLVVAGGVVVGFPLLTALALEHISSARSIVFIGLLPLATAIFGFLRGGERPRAVFWLFSIMGSGLVAGFAATGSESGAFSGDLYMLGAIIVCGLGYAEGGKLSRQLGGWQVICWALVISVVPMAVLCAVTLPEQMGAIGMPAWLGLGYVSLFSMLIGFFFWYRGLALGGIATVGQLQLLQPFMGLILAALILAEPVSPAMIGVTVAVVLCVAGARRFA